MLREELKKYLDNLEIDIKPIDEFALGTKIGEITKANEEKIIDMYDYSPSHRQKYCEKCGSEGISQCPNCNTKIRGYYHVPGFLGGEGPEVPLNFHQCGKAYPWKRKVLMKRTLLVLVSPAKYVIDVLVGIFKK